MAINIGPKPYMWDKLFAVLNQGIDKNKAAKDEKAKNEAFLQAIMGGQAPNPNMANAMDITDASMVRNNPSTTGFGADRILSEAMRTPRKPETPQEMIQSLLGEGVSPGDPRFSLGMQMSPQQGPETFTKVSPGEKAYGSQGTVYDGGEKAENRIKTDLWTPQGKKISRMIPEGKYDQAIEQAVNKGYSLEPQKMMDVFQRDGGKTIRRSVKESELPKMLAKGFKVGSVSDDAFKNEKSLRDTYLKVTGSYQDIVDAYNTVLANTDGTAAGDRALIIAIQKMYDPGSVVRESEFEGAEKARAAWDNATVWLNKLATGELLSENQRKEFIQSAKRVYGQYQRKVGDLNSQFTDMAIKYDLDPQNVILNFSTSEMPAAKGGKDKNDGQAILDALAKEFPGLELP